MKTNRPRAGLLLPVAAVIPAVVGDPLAAFITLCLHHEWCTEDDYRRK